MLPKTLMGRLQEIRKVHCIVFLKSKNILISEALLASRVSDKGTWLSDGKFGHGNTTQCARGVQRRQPSRRTGFYINVRNGPVK